MAFFTAITAAVRDLHPAYFAMVMATGIVSIAAHLLRMRMLATALAWLNVVAFAILWLLTLARLFHHRSRVFADLIDHNRGVPGSSPWWRHHVFSVASACSCWKIR